MPISIQQFVAERTRAQAGSLVEAASELAVEQRRWKPLEKGRSAANQLAECVLINEGSVLMVREQKIPPGMGDMEAFFRGVAELEAGDWKELCARVASSGEALAAAIEELPGELLDHVLDLAWGPASLKEIAVYAGWNMAYHQGQITYISTLL